MTIKTLSQILTEMGESPISVSQASDPLILDESNFYQLTTTAPAFAKKHTHHTASNKPSKSKSKSAIKAPHDGKSTATKTRPVDCHGDLAHPASKQNQAAAPSKPPTNHRPHRRTRDHTPQIAKLLNDAKQGQNSAVINDRLADLLGDVAIEPIAVTDHATNYMRWLAFYYLSKRELSQHELRSKLIAKKCDPDAVNALIIEFHEKGYQSDERCAAMIIRESIRKGRGKIHIHHALKTAGIIPTDSLNALIEQAGIDNLSDGTILADADEVDWLRLAIEARTRKYGDSIPDTPKEKARQLRFLQYRGFEMSVCLDALKYRLSDI